MLPRTRWKNVRVCLCVCAPGFPLALCHCLILTYQFLFLTQSNNAQKIEHLTKQRLRARQNLFHHILFFAVKKRSNDTVTFIWLTREILAVSLTGKTNWAPKSVASLTEGPGSLLLHSICLQNSFSHITSGSNTDEQNVSVLIMKCTTYKVGFSLQVFLYNLLHKHTQFDLHKP